MHSEYDANRALSESSMRPRYTPPPAPRGHAVVEQVAGVVLVVVIGASLAFALFRFL